MDKDIEILKKLIEKVGKNGYKIKLGISSFDQIIDHKIYYKWIFDHSFQKALWGTKLLNKKNEKIRFTGEKIVIDTKDYIFVWEVYAQELSLQENYLDYLARFVNKI